MPRVRKTTRHFISIHTPLAGSDRMAGVRVAGLSYFNPHSPCGERRLPPSIDRTVYGFQSTLPLRGATWKWYYDKFPQLISIHTPLAGSDQPVRRYWKAWLNFNPHSPCGERPHRNPSRWFLWNFNPHSPCGERQAVWSSQLWGISFQSTLPLRGATEYLGADNFRK